MTARTRLWVLAISTPIIVFVLVGGYLGQAMAKDDTYQHLRVFDDVVTHVVNNYVEEVDLKQAMRGAMRGLADVDRNALGIPTEEQYVAKYCERMGIPGIPSHTALMVPATFRPDSRAATRGR